MALWIAAARSWRSGSPLRARRRRPWLLLATAR
jgi:hypothetical protein